MTDLQTATDIVALVFMGLILLGMVILISLALAIKRKVNKLQNNVMDKVNIVRNIPFIGKQIFGAAKRSYKNS